MSTIEPEFQPKPKPIRAAFDGLRAIVRNDPQAAALLSELEERIHAEARFNRFDQLKWKLYFDRWGCRECKADRHLHHALGYCKVCYHRVLERLQALEREWDAKHRRYRA